MASDPEDITTMRFLPRPNEFIPLTVHQSRTPASFFSGLPVLHFHTENSLMILENSQQSPMNQSHLSDQSIENGHKNPENETVLESLVDQTGRGEVDVWVTSTTLMIYNRTLQRGASIRYRAIYLHALQNGSKKNRDGSASRMPTNSEASEITLLKKKSATNDLGSSDSSNSNGSDLNFAAQPSVYVSVQVAKQEQSSNIQGNTHLDSQVNQNDDNYHDNQQESDDSLSKVQPVQFWIVPRQSSHPAGCIFCSQDGHIDSNGHQSNEWMATEIFKTMSTCADLNSYESDSENTENEIGSDYGSSDHQLLNMEFEDNSNSENGFNGLQIGSERSPKLRRLW